MYMLVRYLTAMLAPKYCMYVTRTDVNIELGNTLCTTPRYISSTTKLHLIHNYRLHLMHRRATPHPQLNYISSTTKQHLIHN